MELLVARLLGGVDVGERVAQLDDAAPVLVLGEEGGGGGVGVLLGEGQG